MVVRDWADATLRHVVQYWRLPAAGRPAEVPAIPAVDEVSTRGACRPPSMAAVRGRSPPGPQEGAEEQGRQPEAGPSPSTAAQGEPDLRGRRAAAERVRWPARFPTRRWPSSPMSSSPRPATEPATAPCTVARASDGPLPFAGVAGCQLKMSRRSIQEPESSAERLGPSGGDPGRSPPRPWRGRCRASSSAATMRPAASARRPHRTAAPRRGPSAFRAPHSSRPRPSMDRCDVLLGLGHTRRPRHHARPAGARRGDQRRRFRRPGRRLPSSDPLRALVLGRDH